MLRPGDPAGVFSDPLLVVCGPHAEFPVYSDPHRMWKARVGRGREIKAQEDRRAMCTQVVWCCGCMHALVGLVWLASSDCLKKP
jgi:hypothetical protein